MVVQGGSTGCLGRAGSNTRWQRRVHRNRQKRFLMDVFPFLEEMKLGKVKLPLLFRYSCRISYNLLQIISANTLELPRKVTRKHRSSSRVGFSSALDTSTESDRPCRKKENYYIIFKYFTAACIRTYIRTYSVQFMQFHGPKFCTIKILIFSYNLTMINNVNYNNTFCYYLGMSNINYI